MNFIELTEIFTQRERALMMSDYRRGGALCFEWGFTRTFPGNQDLTVK